MNAPEPASAYLALFRNSADAILLLHGDSVHGNEAAAGLLGWSVAELAGFAPSALFDLGAAEVKQFFARLAEKGGASGDFPVRRKDAPSTFLSVDGTLMDSIDGMRFQALVLRQPGAAAGAKDVRRHAEVGLRAVIDTMPDMFWLKDTAGVYLMCNAEFEKFAGKPAAGIVGRTDYELADHDTADACRLHDADALMSDTPVVREEWVVYRVGGRRALMQTTKARMRDEGGKVLGVLGISRDVTQARRDENLLLENSAVLTMIARGAPLAETLARLVRNIESQSEAMLCSIMLVTADGAHLEFGAGEHIPPAFRAAIDGAAIGPACGSCGTAAYRREPVFVNDIGASKLWAPWQTVAAAAGLHACWSTPVMGSGGELLGTFAIYYREVRSATPDDQRLIEIATSIAAIAIEGRNTDAARRRVEQQLRDDQARLALALEGSGTGVWERDLQTRTVTYSSGWKALFGFAEGDQASRAEDSVGRLHADDLPSVKRAFQAHLEGRAEIYAAEHRVRCKDGRYKWVVSRGKIVDRAADGTPLRMIGATTDIDEMKALAEQARHDRDLITHLTNQVPGLVYQYRRMPDGSSFFPYASEGIRTIYELAPAQVQADGSLVEDLIHAEDRAIYALSLTVSADQLTPWHLEYRVVLPQQGVAWRLGDARPQRLADGSVLWHGFITDISERKRLEKTILENEEQYRTVTENSPDVITRYDREKRRIYVNQRYERFTGIPLRELLGTTPAEVSGLRPESRDALMTALDEVIEQGQQRALELTFLVGGRESIFHMRAIPEFDSSGQVTTVLTFSNDITERKRLEAELQQLATTDFLTGLPNRRHFMSRLAEELARIQRLGVPRTSVLLVDVDHFKRINDTWGHAVGDLVLKHFSVIARGALRRIDTVGRVGGEEFAFILPGADVQDAAVFAERFRRKVEAARVPHEGQELSFTISIGMSAISPDDATPDIILSRTDKALYRAKEGGRNRVETSHE